MILNHNNKALISHYKNWHYAHVDLWPMCRRNREG